MKKAEAISILATSARPREPKDRARYDEAVRMAIEALKCSETPKSSERTVETTQPDHIAESGRMVSISCGHENDLISRQMAIDTIMGQPPEPHYPAWYAAQIEILPSAQPEIIRCKDCRFNDGTAYCLFHFRDVKGEGYCSWAERRTDG